jgi:two-component system NarL family response regulator
MEQPAKKLGEELKRKGRPGKRMRASIPIPRDPPAAMNPRRRRMAKIRVLIADDHPVVRAGLAALIRDSPDMRLVGEAADGRQAVQQFFRYQPDVLLLDLRMQILDGLEVLHSIIQKEAGAKIIILSSYNLPEDVYQAVMAGAKAYLLKDLPREELLESIRSIHKGQINMSPRAAAQLANGLNQIRLTKRETEIVRMMAAGKSNKEIAGALGPTEGTVKVHVGHILKKLAVTGRTEAIREALERGIVHLTAG